MAEVHSWVLKEEWQVESFGYSFLECLLPTLLTSLHGLTHLFMWCVVSSHAAHWAESHLLPKLAIAPYPPSPCSWPCFSCWVSCFQTLPFNSSSSLLLFGAKLANHFYALLFTSFPPRGLSVWLPDSWIWFPEGKFSALCIPYLLAGRSFWNLVTSCPLPVLPHPPLENVLQW